MGKSKPSPKGGGTGSPRPIYKAEITGGKDGRGIDPAGEEGFS